MHSPLTAHKYSAATFLLAANRRTANTHTPMRHTHTRCRFQVQKLISNKWFWDSFISISRIASRWSDIEWKKLQKFCLIRGTGLSCPLMIKSEFAFPPNAHPQMPFMMRTIAAIASRPYAIFTAGLFCLFLVSCLHSHYLESFGCGDLAEQATRYDKTFSCLLAGTLVKVSNKQTNDYKIKSVFGTNKSFHKKSHSKIIQD